MMSIPRRNLVPTTRGWRCQGAFLPSKRHQPWLELRADLVRLDNFNQILFTNICQHFNMVVISGNPLRLRETCLYQ